MVKGLLACTVGIALLFLGASSAYQNLKLMVMGHQTTGRVMSYDVLGKGIGAKYGPIATFEVLENKFKTMPESYTNKREYRIRELVEVVYIPSNPSEAKIKSDVAIGAYTYLPVGVGLLSLLFGFGLLTGRIQQVDELDVEN